MGAVRDELATEMDMLVKGLKIVTRCATEDELVTAFWKFCTPTTCFIPTKDRRRVGIETLFSLRLDDGTVAVRGLCVVRDVWSDGDNPFGRAGIQVAVLRISDDTKQVYARMVARRAAVETARIESRAEMATVEMPPQLPTIAPVSESATDCSIADDPDPAQRARTEVDPVEAFPPIADTAVDQPTARGSIQTLIGMAPPEPCAPRYVSEEPRAVKIASPIKRSWWARVALAVWTFVHWRPRKTR